MAVSGGSLSAISGSGLTRTATFTPTASTNGGTASITVTSSSYTDAAGNSGGAGTTPTLTFDTLAPALTVSNVRLSADTGTSNIDLITTTSVQTISATLSGALTTGDILYGSVNAGSSWTDISNMVSSGSTTITWGPVTLTGSSSIVFKITDAAGNTGSNIGSTNYSVYNSTSTLSISSDDTTLLAGQTATLIFSFSADPGTSFTLGDVTVSGSGGGLASISGSGLTRTAVFTPIAGLDSGTASISVSAGSYTDIAGNSGGAGSALMLTYDTLAPTQTVSGVSISADTGTSSTDLITNTPTQTISATLSSSLSIGDILYGSVDAGSSWTNITSALTALSISWSTTLLSGSNSIVFKVTDAAGNSGNTTGSTSYTLDVSSYQHSAVYLGSIADGLGGGFAIGSRNYDLNGSNYNWEGWGSNISSGGDINGDGLDDLLIATSGAWSYVVFGTTSIQQVKLSDVAAGSGGFVVYGDTSSLSCVAGAGDVNADGLADFLVKANVADNTSGSNYLVFGKTSTTAVYLSAVAAGSGGFAITGAAQYSSNVDSAGDFNGDGVSDLVIGSVQYYSDWTSRFGKSYVLFGSSAGTSRSTDALNNGSEGYVITGYCLGDLAGRSVAGVGDVNGDGYADLLISADSLNIEDNQGSWRTGYSFVVFGRSGPNGIALTSVANGSGGFAIYGVNWEGLGRLVSSAGDVNGDGLADLFVASYGALYVVFGKTTTTAIASSDLSEGSGGFAIYGDNIGSMNSISSAGDINGDGLADLLIGYSDYTRGTNGQAGITYVVFGRCNSSAVYLSAITSGLGGFVIHGQCTYYSGRSVSAAGDVNGDGLSDLFVNDAQWFGNSYVIFGSTTGAFYPTLVTQLGSASADSISGGSAAETLVGGAGNDTIVGGGGADLIQAGSGDDQITIESTTVAALQTGLGSGGNSSQLSRIDGGSGFDTLLLAGSGLAFDLTQVANQGGSTPGSNSRLESIECINITGSGNNSLTLARRDVQDLAGMNRINSITASGLGWSNGSYSFASKEARHQLIINGNAGDSLTVADSNWTFDGTALWNGVTYNVYNGYSSINQLLVNSTISTSINLVNDNIDLNSIVAGSGGFIISGRIVNADGVGTNLSSVGDVNGDGLDDVLVSGTSSTVGTSKVGSIHVVFGNTSTQPIYLSNIAQGSGGFVVYGQTGDSDLNVVAGAGDVNGDGLADILISSPNAKLGSATVTYGRSYVVFGKTSTASVNLSQGTFTSGHRGFVMTGGASQLSGYSISSAGDFNGDGLADVVIGTNTTSSHNTVGKAYVVFGSSTGASKSLTDANHASGSGGFVINGYTAGDLVGHSVAGVGDVNGDGLADLLISAQNYLYSNKGHSFVVFGRTGTGSTVALSAIATGSTSSSGTGGFAIYGRNNDLIGRVVSAAGDVNGDGLADLFIGGDNAAFVVFGKTTSSAVSMDTIVAETGGFVIYDDFTVGMNNNQISAANLSTAGDINGDGLADLLIGMSGPAESNSILDPNVVYFKGITFVVFGRSATTAVHLSDVAAGSGGFVINGQTAGSQSGSSVSAAGDINGDGLADLLVNTGGIVNSYSYVIYGSTSGAFYSTYVDQLGSTSADTITGTSAAETLVGGMGNDTITGAGADVILAGAGNDLITIDSTMRDALQSSFGSGFNTSQLARIDGGSGIDTLALSGSGVTLDLTSVSNQGSSMPVMASRLNSIEWIDLTGSGNNTLKLAIKDIQDLTEANLINSSTASGLLWTNGTYAFASTQRQQLVVTGNAGDILQVSGGTWSNAGTATYNGLTSFNVWISTTGLTQLLVNGSLSVSWL